MANLRQAQTAIVARIIAAAFALRCAREASQSYALEQTAMGMLPKPHPQLKLAENVFWKACRELLTDERTGGWETDG